MPELIDRNRWLLGLFALAAISLAFFFVWWYSEAGDRREYARYEIHFFGSVSGLAEGSPVRYLGVDVGRGDRGHLPRRRGLDGRGLGGRAGEEEQRHGAMILLTQS